MYSNILLTKHHLCNILYSNLKKNCPELFLKKKSTKKEIYGGGSVPFHTRELEKSAVSRQIPPGYDWHL